MRDKNWLFRLVFFMLLFAFPTMLIAQEELTQTYTSADGLFTMNYPEGWVVNDEEDGLVGFNGDGALFQVSFYDNRNSGYAPVTALELMEVAIGEAGNRYFENSEPEELIIAGYPALVSRSDMVDQLNTVMDFCVGVLGDLIGFAPGGELATFEPTFMAMMESIRYAEGDAAACGGGFDDLESITPANAAQISQLMTLGDETVSVESVVFSPDGGQFAAGTLDGSVQIWSTVTGEELFSLGGHFNGVTSVAFGSGGYNLVAGTGGGQVWLWDPIRGAIGGMMQQHSTGVESVAFVQDGFLIASGSLDGEVRLWDMIANGERPGLAEADDLTPVESLAFSPDGILLAAGGGNTIRLWDVEAGTVQAVLETEISEIHSISFRPDGAMLVYGGSDPTAWVWDLANDNHALLEGHNEQVFALAFSPDGQVIASGDSGTVRLWDATTGENLVALPGPSGQAVNSVAFSPDGTLMASGGFSGGVILWGTSAEAAAPEGTGETATNEETTISASTCTITAPNNANLRSGPGTEFDRAGGLSAGQTAEVDGQATGADGMIWYRLTDGGWVRSDVVDAPDECGTVPVVTP